MAPVTGSRIGMRRGLVDWPRYGWEAQISGRSGSRSGSRTAPACVTFCLRWPRLWRSSRPERRSAKHQLRENGMKNKQKADQERRITDSFTKAVELLGKPELEVRLGAIYALERIARESKRDHWPIMETLTAYVRSRAPSQFKEQHAAWLDQLDQRHSPDNFASAYKLALAEGPWELAEGSTHSFLTRPPADIQAVLTVLARRVVAQRSPHF